MTPSSSRPEIVIDLDEARRVLVHYAVGAPAGAARSGGGTANANLVVETERGTFFLRRRNPKYSGRECVAFDHALMEHLAAHDLPTPLALPARDGRRWVELGSHVYELYPFMPGHEHTRGSPAQIADAARRLAEFHRAARDAPLPPGKDWPRYDSPVRIREGLAALALDSRARRHAGDLSFAESQAARLADLLPDRAYQSLPQYVIHGDYHPANLRFLGDRVSGIFDLDWATRQPRLRDLADGLIFFAGQRDSGLDGADIRSLTQTFRLSDDLLRLFLEPYLETERLTPEEWRALPQFLRARWLYCRVTGMAKLPPEERAEYFFAGLRGPLQWISGYEDRQARPPGS